MLLYKWPAFQVLTSLLYLFCLYLLFLTFLSASFCLTIIEIQRRKHRNKEKQQNWNRRWKRQNEVCTQDRQKCPTSEMRQNKTWAKDEGSAAMGCLLMSRSGRWRRKRVWGRYVLSVVLSVCMNAISCKEMRLKQNEGYTKKLMWLFLLIVVRVPLDFFFVLKFSRLVNWEEMKWEKCL